MKIILRAGHRFFSCRGIVFQCWECLLRGTRGGPNGGQAGGRGRNYLEGRKQVGKLVRHQWKYMEDKEDDKKQGSCEQRWSHKFVNDTWPREKTPSPMLLKDWCVRTKLYCFWGENLYFCKFIAIPFRNFFYQTFYGPIFHLMSTFYSRYEIKWAQKVK